MGAQPFGDVTLEALYLLLGFSLALIVIGLLGFMWVRK